jgi:hypothetical protein
MAASHGADADEAEVDLVIGTAFGLVGVKRRDQTGPDEAGCGCGQELSARRLDEVWRGWSSLGQSDGVRWE